MVKVQTNSNNGAEGTRKRSHFCISFIIGDQEPLKDFVVCLFYWSEVFYMEQVFHFLDDII